MKQKETKDAEQKDSLFESLENKENLEKKKKREVLFEMSLFFVLGVLIGITVKTEAVKRITMGFNDYQIVSVKNRYNIEDLKNTIDQKAKEAAAEQANQQQTAPQQTDQQQTTEQQSNSQ